MRYLMVLAMFIFFKFRLAFFCDSSCTSVRDVSSNVISLTVVLGVSRLEGNLLLK